MGPSPARARPAPTELNRSVNIPCFTFDSDCRLHSLNPAARQVLGDELGVEGESFDSLFPLRKEAAERQSRSGTASGSRLRSLAFECAQKSWGETIILEYRLSEGDFDRLGRAEATISTNDDADASGHTFGAFTVVLLRPLPSLARYLGPFKPDVQGRDRSFADWFNQAVVAEADASRRTFQALSAHELSQLINEVHQIVFVSTLAGSVLWVNRRWYEYTGLPQNAAIDVDDWRSVIWPDDLPVLMSNWYGGLEKQEPFSWTYRVRSANGEWRWHQGAGTLMTGGLNPRQSR